MKNLSKLIKNPKQIKFYKTLGKLFFNFRCVNVINRKETGNNFYLEVAKQVDLIFSKILPEKGGAMSLIDVYLYYNRMRGADLISPDDLLQASQHLSNLNSKVELRETKGGLKLLQIRM